MRPRFVASPSLVPAVSLALGNTRSTEAQHGYRWVCPVKRQHDYCPPMALKRRFDSFPLPTPMARLRFSIVHGTEPSAPLEVFPIWLAPKNRWHDRIQQLDRDLDDHRHRGKRCTGADDDLGPGIVYDFGRCFITEWEHGCFIDRCEVTDVMRPRFVASPSLVPAYRWHLAIHAQRRHNMAIAGCAQ